MGSVDTADLDDRMPVEPALEPERVMATAPSAPDDESTVTAVAADETLDHPSKESGSAEPAATDVEVSSEVSPVDMIQQVLEETRRYHARAEQREAVIDKMHSELERLRRGERRGLLRPLLSELSRLRDDILHQSRSLPADFDAESARMLLDSYAESIAMMLADNGVTTFSPLRDEPFEPRRHRAVGREPSTDPASTGRIAATRREGYLDVETNVPVAPAEVVIFVSAEVASPEAPQSNASTVEEGVQ